MKTKKNFIGTAVTVALLIALALACRLFGLNSGAYLSKLLNFIRTFIYIGLISVWGVSVNRRVVSGQVRRILDSTVVMMIFWLTVREFKFRFISNPDVIRYLWYSYYIPIISIPLMALFVSVSLGKSEKYRLPKQYLLLLIPMAVLIALVLTNDAHTLVFSFPENASVRTEQDYTYGPVFFVIVLWCVIATLVSLILMHLKSKNSKRRWLRWLPVIPVAATLLNTTLYAAKSSITTLVTSDIAVLFCLAIMGFFESCIQGGMIQTNTRYFDLFTSSKGISARIVDGDYNTVFSAGDAEEISKKDIARALEKTVMLPDGKLLHTLRVRGGTAVWSEDVSALISLRSTLEDRREELEERNALLRLEYEREKQHKTVREQNRLYDLLQSRTQRQLDRINALVSEYRSASDEEKKQEILSETVVLGSYIKRRKDFALSYDYSSQISESMLESALGESFRALKLFDIKGEYLVDVGGVATGAQLAKAYDFFEDVCETLLKKAKYINVMVCLIDGQPRVSIVTDCCENGGFVTQKYPEAAVTNLDGDGCSYALFLKGGASE